MKLWDRAKTWKHKSVTFYEMSNTS